MHAPLLREDLLKITMRTDWSPQRHDYGDTRHWAPLSTAPVDISGFLKRDKPSPSQTPTTRLGGQGTRQDAPPGQGRPREPVRAPFGSAGLHGGAGGLGLGSHLRLHPRRVRAPCEGRSRPVRPMQACHQAAMCSGNTYFSAFWGNPGFPGWWSRLDGGK